MRTTVEPEVSIKAATQKKHPRNEPRLPAPRTFEERRKTSIFVDRRHQAR